jgi:hypothetical protein
MTARKAAAQQGKNIRQGASALSTAPLAGRARKAQRIPQEAPPGALLACRSAAPRLNALSAANPGPRPRPRVKRAIMFPLYELGSASVSLT